MGVAGSNYRVRSRAAAAVDAWKAPGRGWSPAPRAHARSALKLSLTLSRSSGCVQQAAPQEASPPKYQRDTRASAMARAVATWSDPGQHHNSGSSRLTPGSKCYRAPAPGAANAPARPQGRGL